MQRGVKMNNIYFLTEHYIKGVKKISRSKVYDKSHLISYLKDMERGDSSIFQIGNDKIKIKKIE